MFIMASTFRGVIEFFGELGIYDVILPFLLVFAVTFAILEKTKIFGTEKIGDAVYTRKNYNALVAFCLGFFVVASTKLVAIVNQGMANIAIIMVSFVSFMMTIGVFYKEGESIFDDEGIKKYRPGIIIGTFIVVLLIMLNIITNDAGVSWFMIGYTWLESHWDSNVVGSLVLIGLIVGFMAWIQKGPKATPEKKK
jgi:hypothetical protein